MFCSRLAERGVKNTAGGSIGVGRALHVLRQNPQVAERGMKNIVWGFGGAGSQ